MSPVKTILFDMNESSVENAMTCRSHCRNNENAIALISDLDASRWRLKLDYAEGTGTIILMSKHFNNYSVPLKKKFILRFSPPRQQVMGAG